MEDYQFIGWRLNNDTSITGLVGTRIYHGDIPESITTLPVINYFLISRPNIGNGIAERSRWQINCRAATPSAANNLAHAVHGSFNNLQMSTTGFDCQMAYFDNNTFISEGNDIYNSIIDIFLTHTY